MFPVLGVLLLALVATLAVVYGRRMAKDDLRKRFEVLRGLAGREVEVSFGTRLIHSEVGVLDVPDDPREPIVLTDRGKRFGIPIGEVRSVKDAATLMETVFDE